MWNTNTSVGAIAHQVSAMAADLQLSDLLPRTSPGWLLGDESEACANEEQIVRV